MTADQTRAEPLSTEELRSAVAIARGRIDALQAGEGTPAVVYQRLAEDLADIAATLDAARVRQEGLDENVLRAVFALYGTVPDDGMGPRVSILGYHDEAAAIIARKYAEYARLAEPRPADEERRSSSGLSRLTLDELRAEAERRGITYWGEEWKRRDFIDALSAATPRSPE